MSHPDPAHESLVRALEAEQLERTAPEAPTPPKPCPVCKGAGGHSVPRPFGGELWKRCRTCHGTGRG